MEREKVFFLGAGKMGTASIHHALRTVGLNVTHDSIFSLFTHLDRPHDFLFKYDYYTDGCLQNVANLKKWFPDAKFVLLERDYVNWTKSLFAWNHNAETNSMKREGYLKYVKWVFNSKSSHQRNLTALMIYNKRVINFFDGDVNFMRLDLEKEGDAGWKRLSAFIGHELPIMHTNRQRKPTKLDWAEDVVIKAREKANKASETYPDIHRTSSFRARVFSYCCLFLAYHFRIEKRLNKNIRESFVLMKSSPFNGIVKLCAHLFNFIRMVIFLGIRNVTIPKQVTSPYLT